MTSRLSPALMLLAVIPCVSRAQSDPVRLPTEVVTATRLPGARSAPTTTATVLDGDQLRAEGVTHLADALRRVPGLSLARTSSFGSPTSLFLRGGQSNYVRVLIDGVPVNDPGGVLDLGRITLDDIERIEVVRGPASVLYGSEAVTGVIQLFTRRNRPRSTRAELGGGSFGARRASVGTDGAIAGASWQLQGDHHASDGILAFNNAYRNDGLSGAIAIAGRGRTDVRLTSRYNASSYRYPTNSGGAVEDRNAERAEHRLLVGLDAGHHWTDRFETRLSLVANTLHPRTSDGADDAADTLGFYGYFARGTVTRRVADLRGNLQLGGGTHVSIGGEYAREAERSTSLSQSEYGDSPDAFAAWRETRAGYAQLLGETGRLAYSVGARLDDNTAFGTFRTVRVGATWRLATGTRLRASVGNAFKAPSFYENFSTGFVLGNAALRPERTRSAELGMETLVASRAIVRVTGFAQHFRDLIQYTGAPPAPTGPNYYNIAEADAGGVELEATFPDLLGFAITAGHTWTDTRVVDAGYDTDPWANFVGGGRLLRRPAHLTSLHVLRTVSGVGTFSANVTRTGMREDRDFAAWPPAVVELAAYTLVDLGAELALPSRLVSGMKLQLRAENVANVRTEQIAGFVAPGRTLYAGLKLQR